ncbi:MAG: hypothetical protein AMJ81_09345 [Phycisphaerae bacterium SM23_33]|nr:MAG: hypothetical protein AMJ81_09345 [Phycisphaerae bacterium SM23_33]
MNKLIQWLLGIDPDELAAGESWRLGLIAEHGNYVKLAMIVVLAAMVFLTIRSYRREGDTPGFAKVLLSGLRILVVLLALLVLFRPALILRFTETLRSAVVVVIDDSLSMARKDTYAKSARRPALARFAGTEPDGLAELTRTDLIRKALARREGPVAKLAQDHPLIFLVYSTDDPGNTEYTRSLLSFGSADEKLSQAAKAQADQKLLEKVSEALKLLSASGFETNIARALYDALEEVQGRRVAGVVLFTDGQATADASEKAIRAETVKAARRGVPLLTVMVGDDTLPTNVSVTGLQARRKVSRKSRLLLTAQVAHRNLGEQTVTLRLMRRKSPDGEWSEVGEPKSVRLVKQPDPDYPDDAQRSVGLQAVELTAQTDEVGRFDYKAVADRVEGEHSTDDNFAIAPVEVTDERINVLLISADAGWEFQYLRNILLRQEDQFRVGVWQQSADEEVNQIASKGMELKQLPSTMAELIGSPGGKPHPGYRVVILYDPQPSQARDDQTRGMTPLVGMLRKFVADHGGGLCYIAGNKYSDAVVERDGPFKPLALMLPVVLRPNTIDLSQRIAQQRPEPWAVRLTSYGVDHAVMAIGEGDEQPKDIWPMLPGVYWSHPVHKVKLAARVLAESTNPLRRTSEGEPEPIVAAQPYGTGRVLYIGTDASWRWRFLRDGRYHRKLWCNVVQYLASPKARQVIITAGGDRFDAGKEIQIEVTAYDEDYHRLTDKTFDVEMIDNQTDRRTTLKLEAVKGSPGQYKTTIAPKRAGKFLLTALWGDPNRDNKVQSKEIAIEVPQAEARRPEANPALLGLVASSKENFLYVDEVDRLTELIPADPLRTVREKKREIWDSNITLVLIVPLLAAEWILRKRYNMA